MNYPEYQPDTNPYNRQWQYEYDQVSQENQRLRDAIHRARDIAREAWHNDNIEDFQYDVSEIERILQVV